MKGDFDESLNLPQTKTVQIGNIKFGLIHGHQVVPWGDLEALSSVARQLDVDVLISGHTHKQSINQYDGRYFINPGSVSGAYSANCRDVIPSFILLAVQGDDIVAFVYEIINGEESINQIDFSIRKQQ